MSGKKREKILIWPDNEHEHVNIHVLIHVSNVYVALSGTVTVNNCFNRFRQRQRQPR